MADILVARADQYRIGASTEKQPNQSLAGKAHTKGAPYSKQPLEVEKNGSDRSSSPFVDFYWIARPFVCRERATVSSFPEYL